MGAVGQGFRILDCVDCWCLFFADSKWSQWIGEAPRLRHWIDKVALGWPTELEAAVTENWQRRGRRIRKVVGGPRNSFLPGLGFAHGPEYKAR